MPTRVLYHCPCSTDFTGAYGPQVPSTSSHHLPSLYFCEECDSIRCDLCTTKDLSAFYCPNCLFDVPLASVKTEKAKCPRNCFACPICTATLSVTSSDVGVDGGSDNRHWDPRSTEASVGEPPYYLVCPACRWDSKEIGLVFEKPTGLTLQLQRQEENAADVLEYQQLRAHLDAHLRVSDAPTSALAARTSKLLRDVPSLANDPHFAPNRREAGRAGTMKQAKDEQMLPYQASMTWDAGRDLQRSAGFYQGLEEGKALGHIGRKEQSRIEEASLQTSDKSFTSLAQRWASPADQSMFQKDIGPLRMPLRTKQTKRCPTCRHIIIRPDTKPTSHRFKIRLLALNHLPEVQVRLPHVSAGAIAKDERRSRSSILPSISRRRPAAIDVEALQPGRTYTFEASFFNPLDDAMMVRLHIARASVRDVEGLPSSSPAEEGEQPAWTATPTASAFPINPFNAVWELEEEENDLLNAADGGDDVFSDLDDNDSAELDVVQNDDRELRRSGPDASGARQKRRRGHGILRKRGHETVIGLALKLGPDALGEIEFPMQITFAHRTEADTATRSAAAASRDAHGGASSSERSFSFWTFVRLGHVSSAGERAGSRILPGEDAPEASDAGRRDGLPTSYTSAEARRTALDKRRSVMGLNVTASTLSATSPPGTAAATPHAQPSVLGESSSES